MRHAHAHIWYGCKNGFISIAGMRVKRIVLGTFGCCLVSFYASHLDLGVRVGSAVCEVAKNTAIIHDLVGSSVVDGRSFGSHPIFFIKG